MDMTAGIGAATWPTHATSPQCDAYLQTELTPCLGMRIGDASPTSGKTKVATPGERKRKRRVLLAMTLAITEFVCLGGAGLASPNPRLTRPNMLLVGSNQRPTRPRNRPL